MPINKEVRVDFNNPDGTEFQKGSYQGRIETGKWTDLTEVKGVRYRSWKFEGVDCSEIDGALFEIQPGCRTPIQYIETDHIFCEHVQKGAFLLLRVNSNGLRIFRTNPDMSPVGFTMQVSKGEIMCLYALKENTEPGEVIECEQPGFCSAKIYGVREGDEKIGKLTIPDEFWQILAMLDDGKEDNLPVEIIDIGKDN